MKSYQMKKTINLYIFAFKLNRIKISLVHVSLLLRFNLPWNDFIITHTLTDRPGMD